MTFIISPPEKTAWSFDRERLARILPRDWPDVHVNLLPDERLPWRVIEWTIGSGSGQLEGWQDVEGNAQHLDGPLDQIAMFAQWWRSQVEPSQELWLYDVGYNVVVRLTPGITAREILVGLGAAPDSN